MRQQIISATQAGTTGFKCVDRRSTAGDKFLLIIDMESGSGTVDFEFTPDDCIDATQLIWIQHDVLKDVTESCASTIHVPFQAFRLNVKSYGGGTISARLVQSGDHDF